MFSSDSGCSRWRCRSGGPASRTGGARCAIAVDISRARDQPTGCSVTGVTGWEPSTQCRTRPHRRSTTANPRPVRSFGRWGDCSCGNGQWRASWASCRSNRCAHTTCNDAGATTRFRSADSPRIQSMTAEHRRRWCWCANRSRSSSGQCTEPHRGRKFVRCPWLHRLRQAVDLKVPTDMVSDHGL